MSKASQAMSRASAFQREGVVPPGPRDTVRVVPLFMPDEVKAPIAETLEDAQPPQLVYHGGPLLTSVQVFTIFWGSAWTTSQSQMATKLNAFFDYILTSPLIDQLGEYNTGSYTIGHGKRIGTATITTPTLYHTVSDHAIQHMLQQETSTTPAFPQPGPNTLYFVYLQPGVAIVQGGSRSCQGFCGYHDAIGNTIFYAVVPFANCSGCLGSMSTLDALTSTSSHVLCEAITDPIPGTGWYDQNNGEIGDICAWQTGRMADYTVQKGWSNYAVSCMLTGAISVSASTARGEREQLGQSRVPMAQESTPVGQSRTGNEERISLRVQVDTLTARMLADVSEALIAMHTTSWLIVTGRFYDLAVYGAAGSRALDDEANLVVAKLEHESPLAIALIPVLPAIGGAIAWLIKAVCKPVVTPVVVELVAERHAEHVLEVARAYVERLRPDLRDGPEKHQAVLDMIPVVERLSALPLAVANKKS